MEFAIALPLLISLFCCLGLVISEISEVEQIQLADYGLEEEARYVMERITQEVRFAKEIEIIKITEEVHKIKIVYHEVDDDDGYYEFPNENRWLFKAKDVWETRWLIPHMRDNENFFILYAKRNNDGYYLNPITGDNFFSGCKIITLKYESEEKHPKILHIALEMEKLEDDKEKKSSDKEEKRDRKIKLTTAIFIPGVEKIECHE